jgi:hypothetical protein
MTEPRRRRVRFEQIFSRRLCERVLAPPIAGRVLAQCTTIEDMTIEAPVPQIKPIEGKPGLFAYDFIPDNPELRAEILRSIEETMGTPEEKKSLIAKFKDYLKSL